MSILNLKSNDNKFLSKYENKIKKKLKVTIIKIVKIV